VDLFGQDRAEGGGLHVRDVVIPKCSVIDIDSVL